MCVFGLLVYLFDRLIVCMCVCCFIRVHLLSFRLFVWLCDWLFVSVCLLARLHVCSFGCFLVCLCLRLLGCLCVGSCVSLFV